MEIRIESDQEILNDEWIVAYNINGRKFYFKYVL